MSAEREKLFESLFEIAENYNIPLTNNPDMHRELPSAGDFCGDVESAVLAAGYRKPRTVTTIDELDAAVYAAFEDDGHLVLTDRQGRPWIIWADEDGDEVVNSWPQEEDPERLALSDIRLPATVMHHGARPLLREGAR